MIHYRLAAARPIPDGHWLNDARFDEFRAAYAYASTQTRAIPALASITPADAYYLFEALRRGMERNA